MADEVAEEVESGGIEVCSACYVEMGREDFRHLYFCWWHGSEARSVFL